METVQLDSAAKGRREELIPSRAKQDLVCSVNISEPLCLDSSVVCSLVSEDYCKYLPVYLLEDLSLNSPGFVGAVGAASLHLRLPQEFHSECPQQEEEKDQRWWRRVTRPRCGGPWGNVGWNLLPTCVVDHSSDSIFGLRCFRWTFSSFRSTRWDATSDTTSCRPGLDWTRPSWQRWTHTRKYRQKPVWIWGG